MSRRAELEKTIADAQRELASIDEADKRVTSRFDFAEKLGKTPEDVVDAMYAKAESDPRYEFNDTFTLLEEKYGEPAKKAVQEAWMERVDQESAEFTAEREMDDTMRELGYEKIKTEG